MQYYPLFLNTHGLHCLLVGAGEVGCRKLADLLLCEVSLVKVLDIAEPSPAFSELMQDPRVLFEQRAFADSDVVGMTLVFAATANREINNKVLNACIARGILCNSADNPDAGGFIVPAHTSAGRITAAFSTQRGSPALSRRIKKEIAPHLQKYAALAEVLWRVRPVLLALGGKTADNTAVFRAIVDSPLTEALNDGDTAQCKLILRRILPEVLHDRIGELIYGII